MDIFEITEMLNDLSVKYNIGKLQDIRKEIKNFSRRPGTKLFSSSTISANGWAFHHGGRSEIQFNVGFDEDHFRYGLAFSLQASQSLPDVSVLYPKIFKLNCLIRENPEIFSEYKWWYWNGRERSHTLEISEIPDFIIKPKTFIFIGKLVTQNNIDFNEILKTLDSMLPIYISIEGEKEFKPVYFKNSNTDFTFNKTEHNLATERAYTSVEKEICMKVRHSIIQNKLVENLVVQYGRDNISVENYYNGNRIDVVQKTNTGYIFYEVKTASSVKTCIRQAIGQLLEYGFFPNVKVAEKLIIVGEDAINPMCKKYINFLNQEFGIPVEYMRITVTSN